VTMFRNVQLRVRDVTHQEPWLNFGALSPVWFAGREAPAQRPVVRPLAIEYRALYQTAVLREEWKPKIEFYKAKLREYQARYEAVGVATGVPWFVVGILHAVEAAFNFRAHLHNGDPLDQRTVNVPKGRPKDGDPPFTWEASAADAISLSMGAQDKAKKWKLEELLEFFEAYNGFGMRTRRFPNPYLWSGSTHYEKGRYVANAVFDPEGVYNMVGTAVLLKFAVEQSELVKHLGEKPE
jgi:lysozyme family protein